MDQSKKILFIINPISGIGKKNTIPPLIEKYLKKSKMKWDIRYTERRKHGAIIAREEAANYDAIVAVGGDGSVNEIGSALIGTTCALGILPCGSGNGLARHLKIPLKLNKAIARIAAFEVIKIDTGLVNETPFLGTCGFGFDAHIAQKFDSFGKRGFFSYARLVIKEYNHYKAPRFTISGEDFEDVKDVILCSVANSSQFGNGFTISPNSDIQDGIFELVYLERFKWIKAPFLTQKFFTGRIQKSKHFSSRAFKKELILTVNTDRETYYHIDGEPMKGTVEYTIKIQPKSLKII